MTESAVCDKVYLDKPIYCNRPSAWRKEGTMEELKLYDAEYRLMEIVWELEPLSSTELYKACLPRLGWKKSTTYTVLRKLCERRILKNENSIVVSLVKREDVQRYESQAVVDKWFDRSLPRFVAAFLDEKRLSEEEAEELKQLIDASRRRGEEEGK